MAEPTIFTVVIAAAVVFFVVYSLVASSKKTDVEPQPRPITATKKVNVPGRKYITTATAGTSSIKITRDAWASQDGIARSDILLKKKQDMMQQARLRFAIANKNT